MCKVVMATLGEYDALWDGVLFPEYVDTEYFDCPTGRVFITDELTLMTSPLVQQIMDRDEVMEALLATVGELSQRCPKELYSEGVDAVLTDCPTPYELQLLYPNIT